MSARDQLRTFRIASSDNRSGWKPELSLVDRDTQAYKNAIATREVTLMLHVRSILALALAVAPFLGALGSATASRAAPPTGCASGFGIRIDPQYFAPESGKPYSEARMADYRTRALAAFKAVANQLCGTDPRVAAKLKPIRRIVPRSGAGRTMSDFMSRRLSPMS